MRDEDNAPSKSNMLAGHTLERRRDNMELLRPLKDGLGTTFLQRLRDVS